MEPFTGEVLAVRELCEDVRLVSLIALGQLAAPPPHHPGQHVAIRCVDDGGSTECSYSICNPPRPSGELDICVRRDDKEPVPRALFGSQPGDRLWLSAPRGELRLEEPFALAVLLVATGTGIAPFHAMVDQLRRALAGGSQVQLLYGARRADGLLFDASWQTLQREQPGFRYLPIVSGPPAEWAGRTGRVTDHLDAVLAPPAARETVAYLCGHAEMVADVSQMLTARGFADIRTDG